MLIETITVLTAMLWQGQPAVQEAKKPEAPAAEKAHVKPAEGAKPSEGAKRDSAATTPVDRKEQWWVDRQASFNKRVREGHEKGDIGMLFIGDSITQGWEGAGKEVWEAHFAKRHAVNLGIGGDRTQHVLWRLEHGNLEGLAKPSAGEAPKLAVLMIGTNNVGDTSAPDIAAGIEAIVMKLRAELPATKVLVLAIFPREEQPGKARAKNAEASELVKKLADGKDVFFMDIGSVFLEKDGSISKVIMPDFLHLSPEGYERWAAAIEPKVKEVMGE